MLLLDDLSDRKKWLNLYWSYLWGNVWGLVLLPIYIWPFQRKGPKTIFYNSTGFVMKNKGSCPSLLLACVFHKVSYVARVNTAAVHQTCQAWALVFRTRIWDFWRRELFSSGHRRSLDLPFYKPPDGNICWMQTENTPGDSQHSLSGFPVLFRPPYKISLYSPTRITQRTQLAQKSPTRQT